MSTDYLLLEDKGSLDITQLKELSESVGSKPRQVEKWARALSFSPFVAFIEDKGKLVGFGRIESDGTVYINYDMCVLPGLQGNGLGSVIFLSRMNQATKEGVESIGLSAWTPMARKFYLKHGFKDSYTNLDLPDYMEVHLPRN